MAAAHTQGPWLVLLLNGVPTIAQSGTLATVAQVAGAAPEKQQDANAFLLSAAPELAALLMEAHTGAYDANPIAHSNWLGRVEAALKKAGVA